MKIEHFIKINREANKSMEYSPFNSFDEFWKMVQTKNEIAWNIIQNHYSKIMLCYYYKKGIPQDDAEDLVQITYMKFWKKTSEGELRFTDNKALLVYFLRICERETIQYLRDKLKNAIGISIDDLETDSRANSTADQISADSRVVAREILEMVIKTLESRPHDKDHVQIFIDYYFRGIDTNTIAEKYMKTQTNIRVIIHRQRTYILSKLFKATNE